MRLGLFENFSGESVGRECNPTKRKGLPGKISLPEKPQHASWYPGRESNPHRASPQGILSPSFRFSRCFALYKHLKLLTRGSAQSGLKLKNDSSGHVISRQNSRQLNMPLTLVYQGFLEPLDCFLQMVIIEMAIPFSGGPSHMAEEGLHCIKVRA